MGKKKDKPSIKKSASQKQKLKNRLKGKINIDDNIFGEHWNKDLTVYENYAKLGIISDLGLTTREMKDINKRTKVKSTVVATPAAPESKVISFKQTGYMPKGKMQIIHSFIEKHGDDYEAMARDIKLNKRQLTPAKLRKECEAYYKAKQTWEQHQMQKEAKKLAKLEEEEENGEDEDNIEEDQQEEAEAEGEEGDGGDENDEEIIDEEDDAPEKDEALMEEIALEDKREKLREKRRRHKLRKQRTRRYRLPIW